MRPARSDVDVVRPSELGGAELEAWRLLQRSETALGNPFLSPEFAIAIDRARPRARVAVRRRNAVTDAFFAFEVGRFGVAERIGTGLSDQQAVVCPSEDPWDLQDLLAATGLHALRLENVPAARLPVSARRVVRYPSPVIDLRRGFDDYLDSRRHVSRSMLRTVRRKKRKLEREVGPVRFEFDARDPSALRSVMQWKSRQYLRLAEWDRFAAPDVVAVVDELFESQAPGCAGTLSLMYAGDVLAAAHFGLRNQTVLCSWFPSYNPALARYSPGLLLHLLMARDAAHRGISTFDLGRGEHGYKDLLKTDDLVLARGSVFRPTATGLVHSVVTAPLEHARVLGTRAPRTWAALVAGRNKVRALSPRRQRVGGDESEIRTDENAWPAPTASATWR